LNLGCELLSILPKNELKRIRDSFIEQYYIEQREG
jgi:vacuolar-type H+-ATPase subunit B/Vma2